MSTWSRGQRCRWLLQLTPEEWAEITRAGGDPYDIAGWPDQCVPARWSADAVRYWAHRTVESYSIYRKKLAAVRRAERREARSQASWEKVQQELRRVAREKRREERERQSKERSALYLRCPICGHTAYQLHDHGTSLMAAKCYIDGRGRRVAHRFDLKSVDGVLVPQDYFTRRLPIAAGVVAIQDVRLPSRVPVDDWDYLSARQWEWYNNYTGGVDPLTQAGLVVKVVASTPGPHGPQYTVISAR